METRINEEIELPPDPTATIEALGSLGYSPESALADIIDNSISAGASFVDVHMIWDGTDSWCAVVDDGRGMSPDELQHAMRIGSRDPFASRSNSDLGRFGCGLKTASFSQARQLSVVSKPSDNDIETCLTWDLDQVRKVRRWVVSAETPDVVNKWLSAIWCRKRGTVVFWRRLRSQLVEINADVNDASAQRFFLSRIAVVERHLAMTFGRFLTRSHRALRIRLNDVELSGWDPFMTDFGSTERPTESLPLAGESVLVRPYVLPHRSRLTEEQWLDGAGPKGWNEQQGFYVYRGERLIQAGGWFGLGQWSDEKHNLARISIDVPPRLDTLWHLNVMKSSVKPPAQLLDDLRRISRSTRRLALNVYTHRDGSVGRSTVNRKLDPVWRQQIVNGRLTYRINRSHPLLEALVDQIGTARRDFIGVLHLLEETVPTRSLSGSTTSEQRVPFEDEPDASLVELADRIYQNLLTRGFTREGAAGRLAEIEPFNQYPDVVESVTSTDGH